MSFTRIALNGGAGLYAWSNDAGPMQTSWAGYLLTTGADTVSTLTAQEAWENYWGSPIGGVNGGIYLFATEAPTDPAAYLSRLRDLVARLNSGAANFAYRYFLWNDNPNATGPATAQPISFARDGSGQRGTVKIAASLQFRNIRLDIAVGVDVRAEYTLPSFTLSPFSSATLAFYNTIGVVQQFGQISQAATLELGGVAPGRMTMRMKAQAMIPTGDNDLRKMRTGVEYFFSDEQGNLVGRLYPVLNKTASSDLYFDVRIDPLFPLDATRTAFMFGKGSSGANPPRFDSYFATADGHTVRMTPIAGESGYVLQREMYPLALIHSGPQTPTYYFAPIGPSVLSYDPNPPGTTGGGEPTAPTNLLCGLAGTETISFDPPGGTYQGDILTFHADKPAYAPIFPLPQVNLREPNSPPIKLDLLRDDYTTAWASIKRGASTNDAPLEIGANEYYSQPHGASLYANDGGTPTNVATPPVLDFYQTPLAQLGAGDEHPFPLIPYVGAHLTASTVNLTPAQIARFEAEIVSPTRKDRILAPVRTARQANGWTRLAANADLKPTTTPQGLLATIAPTDGGKWASLLLAHNVDKGTTYNLQFLNVDPTLQEAFQTNQQFLVITQPKNPWTGGSNTTFENTIAIEGWPFRINVGRGNVPGDYRNVLIFKFVSGTLTEWAKNPSNWTSAADFNDEAAQGLAFLSQWLQDYVAEARAMAEFERQQGVKESYFQNFIDIADSETWNGILALKVDIGVEDFPPELKGLIAGIDLSRFYAHHFGVEVNFVQASGGGVEIAGNSSLFGLIYYVNPAYANQLALGASPDRPVPAAPADYDFNVLTLKVLFENTAIRTFESKLQVTANRLFGDMVNGIVDGAGKPLNLPSSSIILDGAYEEHDGQSTFTFTFNADRLFSMKSNVLGVVEIVQAGFSTLSDKEGRIESRFSFSGYLNFLPVEKFDLFSFGGDWIDGAPGMRRGLFFSNLFIDMAFAELTPTERTFRFNADQITFNLDQSTPRKTSLYANFPLRLVGMTSGASDKGPTKLGYLQVAIDGPFAGLRGDWNGLTMALDLGTAGALAENVGLTSQLVAAWSAGSGGVPSSYDVQVGIRLPGTGGGEGKLLSLQGIFSLAIDSIELLLGETQDSRPAYMMKFTQIGLKFFGVKFPTSGNTVFFLFGDPNPGAPQNSLGWYAAYNKDNKAPALPPVQPVEAAALDDTASVDASVPDTIDPRNAKRSTEEGTADTGSRSMVVEDID